MKKISIDLDWTLFDLEPIIKSAFKGSREKYTRQKFFLIQDCYSPEIVKKLERLLNSKLFYETPLLDQKIPDILNRVYFSGQYNVNYVTDRSLYSLDEYFLENQTINEGLEKNLDKTIKQLINSKIPCNKENVFELKMRKIEVLKKIKSELHFDDAPHIIESCQKNGIPCVMISNDKTLYNHFLRDKVKWYPNMVAALQSECPVE